MDAARQCKAKSKRSGERCKRAAIVGGTVCSMHGGKAPHVIATARQRLAALVDPAITVLTERLSDELEPAVQLAVARDVLDRAGYSGRQKVELSGSVEAAVSFDFSGFSDTDLEQFLSFVRRAGGGG